MDSRRVRSSSTLVLDGYGKCFLRQRFRSLENIPWDCLQSRESPQLGEMLISPLGMHEGWNRGSPPPDPRLDRSHTSYFKYRLFCSLILVEMANWHSIACVQLVLSNPMRTPASQPMNTCPPSSIWVVTRRMAALPWLESV